MNIFNGKLELQAVSLVTDTNNQWDIAATFIDMGGAYFATDAQVGDVMYNDGSMAYLGLLRYKIISIDPASDFSSLYARVEWSLSTEEPAEPLCGFETMLGRPSLGAVFLPAPDIQGLSDGFIQYARNIESWLAAKYSYINRVYDAEVYGAIDGVNDTFTPVEAFIPDTLKVKYNGSEQRKGADYSILGGDIKLNFIPAGDDSLVFDFNKL